MYRNIFLFRVLTYLHIHIYLFLNVYHTTTILILFPKFYYCCFCLMCLSWNRLQDSPTAQSHLTRRRHSTSIISRPPSNQVLYLKLFYLFFSLLKTSFFLFVLSKLNINSKILSFVLLIQTYFFVLLFILPSYLQKKKNQAFT